MLEVSSCYVQGSLPGQTLTKSNAFTWLHPCWTMDFRFFCCSSGFIKMIVFYSTRHRYLLLKLVCVCLSVCVCVCAYMCVCYMFARKRERDIHTCIYKIHICTYISPYIRTYTYMQMYPYKLILRDRRASTAQGLLIFDVFSCRLYFSECAA